MKIPSQFKLMGCTWTVHIQEEGEWNDDTQVGLCRFKTCEIFILRSANEEMMGHVFFHELTHAILESMSSKLYDDEKFVDLLSGLLHQALTTAK